MRCTTGSADDDFKAAFFSARCKLRSKAWGTMSGDDSAFVSHTKLIERFTCVSHRVPVRLAAHDDGNQ
jgi:hypothetical protein